MWTRKEKEREIAKKDIWKGRRKRVTEESLRETGQTKIKKVGYGGGGGSLQEEREGEGREKGIWRESLPAARVQYT